MPSSTLFRWFLPSNSLPHWEPIVGCPNVYLKTFSKFSQRLNCANLPTHNYSRMALVSSQETNALERLPFSMLKPNYSMKVCKLIATPLYCLSPFNIFQLSVISIAIAIFIHCVSEACLCLSHTVQISDTIAFSTKHIFS